MAGNTKAPGQSVTSRVLAILATFDGDHRSQRLTDIARRAGISLPTTHRITSELAAWGALFRQRNGEYVIGSRIWELGMLTPQHCELVESASPYIGDLHAATRTTVHLAVRDGDRALYVDRIFGRASVPVISTVGSRLPLYPTGVGKVLLSYAPKTVVSHVLSRLEPITPYTVTSPGRLLGQLLRARRDGYATTAEEMTLGACSIAVPIFDKSGSRHAALGVVVPRLDRDFNRLLAALRVAAHGIERDWR